MAVTNTLACYNTATIRSVKSFMVWAPGEEEHVQSISVPYPLISMESSEVYALSTDNLKPTDIPQARSLTPSSDKF